MLDHPTKSYRQFGPETFSALALMLFSVPTLVFSVFLTVLKFRTQYRCDGFLQNNCTSGCSTALSDSLSEVWGIPLTAFAAAYYFVLLGFALVVGLWPRDLAPAARFPVLVLGLGSLALSVFLGLYAWFALDVLCEYCCLLYVASVGVFLSARLLNPEGVLRGLLNGFRRMNAISLTLMVVAATAFLSLVLVQKRLWVDYAVAVLGSSDLDCQERQLQRLPETHFTLASDAEPEVVVAVFMDLACPHCKKDFDFWRKYQGEHSDVLQVEFFHFAGGAACGPLSISGLERHESCNASLAAECLHSLAPGQNIEHLARLFAMQEGTGPYFSQARMESLAAQLTVPDLLTCMNDPATLRDVRHHIVYGKSQGLRSPPSALLVPMKRQGRANKPLGRALALEGGGKPTDYIDRAVSEVQSWRNPK